MIRHPGLSSRLGRLILHGAFLRSLHRWRRLLDDPSEKVSLGSNTILGNLLLGRLVLGLAGCFLAELGRVEGFGLLSHRLLAILLV